METHPMASQPAISGFPSVVSTFDGLTPDEMEALARNAEPRELRRGEILIRQGELSDTLHFVVSGRFSVHTERVDEPIAEIGQGEPIGEIGFFANTRRTATVTALRDSRVVTITRQRFAQLSESLPNLRDSIITPKPPPPQSDRPCRARWLSYGPAKADRHRCLSNCCKRYFALGAVPSFLHGV
jgi:NTE family protein